MQLLQVHARTQPASGENLALDHSSTVQGYPRGISYVTHYSGKDCGWGTPLVPPWTASFAGLVSTKEDLNLKCEAECSKQEGCKYISVQWDNKYCSFRDSCNPFAVPGPDSADRWVLKKLYPGCGGAGCISVTAHTYSQQGVGKKCADPPTSPYGISFVGLVSSKSGLEGYCEWMCDREDACKFISVQWNNVYCFFHGACTQLVDTGKNDEYVLKKGSR